MEVIQGCRCLLSVLRLNQKQFISKTCLVGTNSWIDCSQSGLMLLSEFVKASLVFHSYTDHFFFFFIFSANT